MKTNELRLGNYISVDCIMYKEELKVTEVYPNGVFAKTKYSDDDMPEIGFIKEEDIEPIELTEEVLLKMGFEKDGNEWWIGGTDEDETTISYSLENSVLFMRHAFDEEWKNWGKIKLYNIKYLHQLQNAYYLLTNQELEIEL